MNPYFRHFRDASAGPLLGADKEAMAGVGVQPTLEIAGQRRVPGPTDAHIREAVLSLDATTTYAFLILDRDARHSLEVSGDAREGFELEHYDGKSGRRYRAVGDFSAEQVIALLVAYRDAAAGWQNLMPWEELDE
jgi:hypothetical protein